MAPKWLSKVPWTTIAEFFLSWWKGRKKDDGSKGDSSIPEVDNGPTVDSSETRPVE